MFDLTIDISLFVCFLALNLGVGLWYSRGVKTLRQYAVGDKQFSTMVIALTIVATWATGSGLIQWGIYGKGLIGFATTIQYVLSLLLLGLLAIRGGEFLKHLTIAESMGSIYGDLVRRIVAISSILCNAGLVAAQFKVIGNILAELFHVSPTTATCLIALLIIIYTIFGGIKAVTFTDLLQFIVLGVFIPSLALAIWMKSDPSSLVGAIVEDSENSLRILAQKEGKIFLLVCLLTISWLSFSSAMFQRLQMAKSVYQARKAFLYAVCVATVMAGFYLSINLMLRQVYPGASKLELYSYISSMFGTRGFLGLMAMGLTAMGMSTADSMLNSSAVLVANDLVFHPHSSAKRKLTIAKVAAGCIGLGSLSVALYFNNLVLIGKYVIVLFYPPVVVPLLLLTLLGFRGSKKAALIGMAVGFLVAAFLTIKSCFKSAWTIVLLGMVANICSHIGIHYLLGEPGGWVGVKEKAPLKAASKMRDWWWKYIKSSTHLSVLHERLVLNLPKKGEHYFLIGLYAFLSNYLALYGLQATHFSSGFFQGILYLFLIATSLVMTYAAWPAFMKRQGLMAWMYPLLFSYVFFVTTPIIAALGQYRHIYLVLMLLHLVIAILMFSPYILLTMVLLGTFCTSILLKLGDIPLPAWHTTSWDASIVYLGFMTLIFFLVLFRHQATTKKLFVQNHYMKRLQNSLQHDIMNLKSSPERFVTRLGYGQYNGLNKVHTLSQEVIHTMKEQKVDSGLIAKISDLSNQIKDNATYLDQMMYSVESSAYMQPEKIDIAKLLSTLAERHAATGSNVKLVIKNDSDTKYFFGHREKIEDCLAFLIHKTAQKAQNPYLFFAVLDTEIVYPSSTIHFDALAFALTSKAEDPPLKPYYIYRDKPTVSLSTAELTAERHYGYFDDLDEAGYVFVLPQDIRITQPQTIQAPPISLSDQVVMHARKVEGDLWATLLAQKSTQPYNLSRITLALNIMKAVHGYQLRKSGHLFYTHPLQVATYVLQHSQEEDLVIAALLHDAVEDTDKTMEEVRITFGKKVKEIIQGLTNLKSGFKKYKIDKSEKIIELCLASDPAISLIKLCDRLHNMQTIDAKPSEKRVAKAEETMALYVPLARKLGFSQIADELEKLSKPYLAHSTSE